MGEKLPEPETYLELGMLAFALTIAGAGFALLFGRLFGGMDDSRRRGKAAPRAGEMPSERHQHVGVSSAR